MLLMAIRKQGALRVPLTVLACVVVGAARGSLVDGSPVPLDVGGSTGAIGVIASLPVAGGEFERVSMQVERVRHEDGSWHDAMGIVVLYLPERREGVSLRDRVSVTWNATEVSVLPPGYGAWVRTQGASATAWARTYEIEAHGPGLFAVLSDARRGISGAVMSALPGDPGALASGIVTGDDSGLSAATEDAFRRTGTAHITAVSGQNVALLIGFLSLWIRPATGVSRLLTHGTMLMTVWLYATMVGLEPPALRAATVASLTILGAWTGRRPDPLTLLALTLGVMALIDPLATRAIGFWLSASASLALCTVVQPEARDGIRRPLLSILIGPMAASLATLPILIAVFHEWSPVTPFANAILSPIMTLLFSVTYVFALIALIPGPLASLMAWIPGIGLDLVISVVHRMATIAPQVQLDGAGLPGTVMIAVPCLAVLVAFSRDGGRWIRIIGRI
jgi:competence protein ComEC